MTIDLHNVITAEKVSSRGHLYSIPTPEKDDHRPSINIHWNKVSQRGQTQLLPEEQRRHGCDQWEETIKHYLR